MGNLITPAHHFFAARKYFLLSAVLFLLSCENDMAEVKALATKEDTMVDVADSLHLIYSENGLKRAVITAKRIHKWNPPENKTEFLDGLKVTFYQEGRQVSELVADYGVNDDLTKKMLVKGNVRMENNKGEILETASLVWDENSKRIRAEGGLSVRTPDEIAYGTGLDSDEDFSNYTITRIKGIFSLDDNDGFRSR